MRLASRAVRFLAAAVSSLLTTAASAENVSWNNAAGGNWNVAANWNPQKVPAPVDDVFITLAGTYTVTLNVDTTVASLVIGAGGGMQMLSNTSRTLTLQGAGSIGMNGVYRQEGGTLTGTGAFTIHGRLDWLAGTMSGSGVTSVSNGGAFNLSSDNNKNLLRSVNNFGTTTWTDGGAINVGNGAVFANKSGGNLNIQNDRAWAYTLAAPPPQFVNEVGATVTKGPSLGTTTFINLPFMQNGTVNVNSGVLTINGGGTSTAPFNVANGARLDFNAGTYNLAAGSGFIGMGPVRVNGGTLAVGADTSAVNFELMSGTLNGSGGFTVTDTFDWSLGNLSGSGATNIPALAALNLSSDNNKNLLRSVNNFGTTTWTDGGAINVGSGAVFANKSGGNLNIQNDRAWAYTLAAPPPQFVNEAGATVTKSPSLGTTTFINLPFMQNGTVNVNSGVLTINGGGTSTAPFNVANGARLDFNAGTYNLAAGSGFIGMGPVRVNGGTLAVGADTSAVNFELMSGTLNGSGGFTVTDTFDWSLGNLSGSGATNIPALAALNLSSDNNKNLLRSVNNFGTTTWTDGGAINVGSGAVFANKSGGNLNIQNDRAWAYTLAAPPPQFVNEAGATVTKSPGVGTTTFSNLLVANSGVVNVMTGVLAFTGVYTQTAGATHMAGGNLSTTTMLGIQGGVLDGIGVVTGSVSNSGGHMNPGTSPGQVRITVDFVQASGGDFNVDIDGLVAGVDYDQLVVTRTVDLAGDLNVSAGFAPAPGTAFTIIDNEAADSVVGSFAGLPEGATVNANGAQFIISYVGGSGNDVILTAGGGVAPSRTPTSTPTRTSTPSPTGTPTLTPGASATPTNSPANTATPSVTSTRTPTRSATPAQTGAPSATSTRTATQTATRTPTRTPTSSPTLTATTTMAELPTPTPTSSPADMVSLRGRCLRPGRDGDPGDHGQIGAVGAIIRLYFCERSRRGTCLDMPGEPIAEIVAATRGFFIINIPRRFLDRRLFVLSVTFGDVTGFRLRTLAIIRPRGLGNGSGAGEPTEDVVVDAISEAAVQLLDEQGLQNFEEEGIEAVIDAVDSANVEANFEDMTPVEAVGAALATAAENPNVQMVLEENRVVVCPGDCDGDGAVTVDEIVRCVSIALGSAGAAECPSCDIDFSGTVTVDEIITSVNNALNSCPPVSAV